MKTKHNGGKPNLPRAVFCLVLAAALLSSLLVLNGFAAGADPANFETTVSSCSTHTAVLSKGDLYVWGSNDAGQFPNSTLPYSVEPVKVASDVKDVAVADDRTLVLNNNGALYLYGRDPVSGRTGLKQRVYGGVAQMSCGEDFALLVTTRGSLMAWGMNTDGQLGSSTAKNTSTPVLVQTGGVKKAVAGKGFALSLDVDGKLYGWGRNGLYQLGYEENGEIPTLLAEPTLLMEGVKDIDAGESFSCILKNDDTLWTCGLNESSQLGIGTLETIQGYSKILSGIRSFSAGSTHGFAVGKNGKVYSWGFGLSGQLGDGTRQRNIAAAATDLDFIQVFSGADSTFALDAQGALWAWGSNENMVLGRDVGDDAAAPVQIMNADVSWSFAEPEPELETEPEQPAEEAKEEQPAKAPSKAPAGASSGTADAESGSEQKENNAVAFASGYTDGTFRPDHETTRAEFLTMLVTAVGGYDGTADYGAPSFADVDPKRWYASYIAFAQQKGLVSGYKDNTFQPDAKITRAEAATMAMKILGLENIDAAPSAGFTDITAGHWGSKFINSLVAKGVLGGYPDGTFRPDSLIKRSEAVTLIAKAAGFDPSVKETAAAILSAKNPFRDVSASSWAYAYILRAAGLVG